MYQDETKKGRGREAFQSLEVVLVDDAKGKRAPRDTPAPENQNTAAQDFFSADVTGTHLRATGHCTERPLLHLLLLHLPSHVGINKTLRQRPPLPQTEDQIASSAAMSPRSHASGMSGGRSHVSLISAPGVAFAAQAGSTTADRRPESPS